MMKLLLLVSILVIILSRGTGFAPSLSPKEPPLLVGNKNQFKKRSWTRIHHPGRKTFMKAALVNWDTTRLSKTAKTTRITNALVRYAVPLLGIVGGATQTGIDSWIRNICGTKLLSLKLWQVSCLLFVGGMGGKVADEIDDGNLWKQTSNEDDTSASTTSTTYSWLHTGLARNLLTLGLHLNSAATFLIATTCAQNPVPSALLIAMYSQTWIVRGKLNIDLRRKPMEALAVLLAGFPFWASVGWRWKQPFNDASFGLVALVSFGTSTWWLKHGRKSAVFTKTKQAHAVANAITETGIFRTISIVIASIFGGRPVAAATLSGVLAFHADTVGFAACKQAVNRHNIKKNLAIYGVFLSAVLWSAGYFVYGCLREHPFAIVPLIFVVSWEAAFAIFRFVKETGVTSLSARRICPFLCVIFDIFMGIRAGFPGYVWSSTLLATLAQYLAFVSWDTTVKGKWMIGMVKYSVWVNTSAYTQNACQFTALEPGNLGRRLALFLFSLGSIASSTRSLNQLGGKDKAQCWCSPVVVTVILQCIYALWLLVMTAV